MRHIDGSEICEIKSALLMIVVAKGSHAAARSRVRHGGGQKAAARAPLSAGIRSRNIAVASTAVAPPKECPHTYTPNPALRSSLSASTNTGSTIVERWRPARTKPEVACPSTGSESSCASVLNPEAMMWCGCESFANPASASRKLCVPRTTTTNARSTSLRTTAYAGRRKPTFESSAARTSVPVSRANVSARRAGLRTCAERAMQMLSFNSSSTTSK